jgi:hypothetical protein
MIASMDSHDEVLAAATARPADVQERFERLLRQPRARVCT